MATYRQKWDSVEEMILDVEKNAKAHLSVMEKHHYHGRESFVGRDILTWDKAKKAARATWVEGMATYKEMRGSFRGELPRPKSIRRRLRWREDMGDEVCLDRLRSGQPFWRATHREAAPSANAVVTVAFEIGSSSRVDSKKILWKGIAAIVLADLLEEAGYRVELWGMWRSLGSFVNRHNAYQAYKLKEAQDPINVAGILTAVSGWFFRTVGFESYAGYKLGKVFVKPIGSLGSPGVVTKEDREFAGLPEDLINCGLEIISKHAAEEWIRKQLVKFQEK